MDRQLTPAEFEIYSAYLTFGTTWVALADLRPLVEATREEQDAALISLARQGDAILATEAHRVRNSPAYVAAALRMGAEAKDLIAFEEE
jgi:hypothetical protein